MWSEVFACLEFLLMERIEMRPSNGAGFFGRQLTNRKCRKLDSYTGLPVVRVRQKTEGTEFGGIELQHFS